MAADGEIPIFPAPVDETGLVGFGGRLTPDWMLAAYAQGAFPWPIIQHNVEHLAWFSPDPRAILPLQGFHVPRRLARRLRRGEFAVRWNTRFEEVVDECAAPRGDDGVWLSAAMKQGYAQLHELSHAHSLEVWQGDKLTAGILGVSLQGLFSAESMFHRVSGAGSAAIAMLVESLGRHGFCLLDIQQSSAHMDRRGAIEIPRSQYLQRLQEALSVRAEPLGSMA